jgi:hypothetical protein
MMAFEYCAKLHAKRTIIPFDVIPGAWAVRLFCGTRKPARPIASDDNPDGSAVSVRFKIPQLHSRYVRYDFRNGCSPSPSLSNLIRSAASNSDGFLKLEGLDFL